MAVCCRACSLCTSILRSVRLHCTALTICQQSFGSMCPMSAGSMQTSAHASMQSLEVSETQAGSATPLNVMRQLLSTAALPAAAQACCFLLHRGAVYQLLRWRRHCSSCTTACRIVSRSRVVCWAALLLRAITDGSAEFSSSIMPQQDRYKCSDHL